MLRSKGARQRRPASLGRLAAPFSQAGTAKPAGYNPMMESHDEIGLRDRRAWRHLADRSQAHRRARGIRKRGGVPRLSGHISRGEAMTTPYSVNAALLLEEIHGVPAPRCA